MTNCCGDNRFKIIEKAKEDILRSTNIETSKDEMKVLDNFLFRCWQMDWLGKYESTKSPWISVKDNMPYNNKGLLLEKFNCTEKFITRDDENNFYIQRMYKLNGFWKWEYPANITHWFAIPELPKD